MSVRKREDYAEISVFCNQCKKQLILKVENSRRDSADRFPFEYLYIHGEPQHALTLYLDKDMQVRGVELVKNINMDKPDVEEAKLIPQRKGNISPMARSLGMISQKEFEVWELCDGKISIYDISQKKTITLPEINRIFAKLKEKGLVDIKK
jgi:uncharacterized protein YcgL (UPF0745 family)